MNNEKIFAEILKEGFQSYSGYVPHDGNGMVGGKYGGVRAHTNNTEVEIPVELNNKWYMVYLKGDIDLDYSYDDSTNCGESYDYDFDINEFTIDSVYSQEKEDYVDGRWGQVTDDNLIKILGETAKEYLDKDPDEYLNYLWEDAYEDRAGWDD